MFKINQLIGFGTFSPLQGGYSIVGGGIGSSASGASSLSLTYPSLQAGDLLIAIGQVGGDVSVSASGWTDFANATYTIMHYKVALGTESGTQSFTFGTANGGASGEIIRIRNTGRVTPLMYSWNGGYDADGSVDFSAPQQVSNNRNLCFVFAGDNGSRTVTSAPSGWTAISSKTTTNSGFTYWRENPSANFVATFSSAVNWRTCTINVTR